MDFSGVVQSFLHLGQRRVVEIYVKSVSLLDSVKVLKLYWSSNIKDHLL